jgi:cytoskeletal protein RodZ
MKTFVALVLTLVLTAATLVGCGCTNQNMDNTSAPTVLPTNEEIWNSTESTTRSTTESTRMTETTEATTESTNTTGSTNETEIHNYVNAQQDLNEKIKENQNTGRSAEGNGETNTRRMVPGSR